MLLTCCFPGLLITYYFFSLPVKVIFHLPRRLVNFALLLVSRRSFNISPPLQTGVILLLLLSVVKGSAIELIVVGACYRGSQSLVTTRISGR